METRARVRDERSLGQLLRELVKVRQAPAKLRHASLSPRRTKSILQENKPWLQSKIH